MASLNTNTSTINASTGETSIRVVVFSGKHEDWENWKEIFLVKAGIRGYDGVINGDDKVPPTHKADEAKETLTPEQSALVDLNKKVFGDLVLSIDCNNPGGIIAFSLVKATKTKDFPGGNLFKAFEG
jgi:hypothetical protein